jgi:hypothetical protein
MWAWRVWIAELSWVYLSTFLSYRKQQFLNDATLKGGFTQKQHLGLSLTKAKFW